VSGMACAANGCGDDTAHGKAQCMNCPPDGSLIAGVADEASPGAFIG